MERKPITDKQMENFYDFLQGIMTVEESKRYIFKKTPKLSPKLAMAVVWYLQEIMCVLPDNYEQCFECKQLFDIEEGGLYWESKERHYCSWCERVVPLNYDNNRRKK